MTHADALAARHLKGALARHGQRSAGLVDGRGWTRRRGNHAQVTAKTGILAESHRAGRSQGASPRALHGQGTGLGDVSAGCQIQISPHRQGG